jgi:hypothetical protein
MMSGTQTFVDLEMRIKFVCLVLCLYVTSYSLEYFGLYLSGEFGHLASDYKKWSVCGVYCKKEEEEEDSVYFRSLSFDFVTE